MLNQIILALSVLMILSLVVFLVCEVRRPQKSPLNGGLREGPNAINPRQFLLTFIVLGSLISFIGGIWLCRVTSFVAHATKAPGRVNAIEVGWDSRFEIHYPVFTFLDAAGISHTQRSSLGSSRYPHQVGEKVTILYDSSDPKTATIDSFFDVWSMPLATTSFGLVFAGFSWFMLFLISRTRTRNIE